MSSLQAGSAWKLSPSDLTFLYEECPRCFWLKVVGNFPRPKMPFPRVFTLLDLQTKTYFSTKRTEKISPSLPPGRVAHGDRWVRSMPIRLPGRERPLHIAGRIDTAFAFDDGTHGIVDFKTTIPSASTTALYGRQLNAYALAAENPAPGNLRLAQVSRLGLLCFEPTRMGRTRGAVAYLGNAHWIEIVRDDRAFMKFLTEVSDLLELPSPPAPGPGCGFCAYLLDGVVGILAAWLRSDEEMTAVWNVHGGRARPHLKLVPDPQSGED